MHGETVILGMYVDSYHNKDSTCTMCLTTRQSEKQTECLVCMHNLFAACHCGSLFGFPVGCTCEMFIAGL